MTMAADRRADERDQRRQAGQHRQRRRERHAEDLQHDERLDARDQRDRQRALDVAADRVGGAVEDAAHALALGLGSQPQRRVGPAAAAGDDEDAQDEDVDQREDRVDEAEADVAQHLGRVADLGRQLVGLLLQLAGQVVLVVELAQPLVLVDVVLDVVGVVGQVLDEVGALGDQRRDDERGQPDRHEDQPEVDERDRKAAPHVAVEPVDRPGDRDRDERRRQHPADRLAQQVDAGTARAPPATTIATTRTIVRTGSSWVRDCIRRLEP